MFVSSFFEMIILSSCISYQMETVTEIPLGKLDLKHDTVPCLLPGCLSYYSFTWAMNGLVSPMSYDSKENRLINPFN